MPHEHPIVLPRPRRKPATQRMLICCNCGANFCPAELTPNGAQALPILRMGSGAERSANNRIPRRATLRVVTRQAARSCRRHETGAHLVSSAVISLLCLGFPKMVVNHPMDRPFYWRLACA